MAGWEYLDLPNELLSSLSQVPCECFTCAICEREITARWASKPRAELAPICWSCENISGWRWNGGAYYRTKPKGGSHMDKRNAVRIAALSDAIALVANQKIWSERHAA